MNKKRIRKPMTDEHRLAISEALKGRKGHPQTDEHRKKMSEGMKAFWAKIRKV